MADTNMIQIIADQIKQTEEIYNTVRKTLDQSYKLIEERNTELVKQLHSVVESIAINNSSAKKLPQHMSEAMKDLMGAQVELEKKIKALKGIKE